MRVYDAQCDEKTKQIKQVNIAFPLLRTCRAFLGHGDSGCFLSIGICFVLKDTLQNKKNIPRHAVK